jgi:hypothetical protein
MANSIYGRRGRGSRAEVGGLHPNQGRLGLQPPCTIVPAGAVTKQPASRVTIKWRMALKRSFAGKEVQTVSTPSSRG